MSTAAPATAAAGPPCGLGSVPAEVLEFAYQHLPPTARNIPTRARRPLARLLLALVEDANKRAVDGRCLDDAPIRCALRLAIPAGINAKAMVENIRLPQDGQWAAVLDKVQPLTTSPSHRRGTAANRASSPATCERR